MAVDRLSQAGTRNLAILPAFVAAAAFFYWWGTFSPPYRWLIDAQVLLTGTYSELIAVPVFAVIMIVAASAVAAVFERSAIGVSYGRAEAVVLLVLAGLSVMAALFAWAVWQQYATRPTRNDPVQVVDLDRADLARLRNAHVRLIGRADFAAEVALTRRKRRGTYKEYYVPVVGRRGGGTSVSVVGTDLSRGDPLDGLLLRGGLGTRTEYQLRRGGMPVMPGAFILTNRERDLELPITLAIFFLVPVVITWPMILYQWLSGGYARERRAIAAGTAGPGAVSAPRPVDGSVPLSPARPATASDASAAGLPTPPKGMALLCVLRDARVHGSAYYRIDVDGRRVAELRPRQYVCIPLSPGQHVIATNIRISLARSARLRLDARAGEVFVFRMKMPLLGAPRLEAVESLDEVGAVLPKLGLVTPRPARRG